MKLASSTVLAGTFLSAILALAPAAQAKPAGCSNATLKGHYSALLTGSVNGLPFAALDLVVSDGNGTSLVLAPWLLMAAQCRQASQQPTPSIRTAQGRLCRTLEQLKTSLFRWMGATCKSS